MRIWIRGMSGSLASCCCASAQSKSVVMPLPTNCKRHSQMCQNVHATVTRQSQVVCSHLLDHGLLQLLRWVTTQVIDHEEIAEAHQTSNETAVKVVRVLVDPRSKIVEDAGNTNTDVDK